MANYNPNVKFQDAFGFYRLLFKYKDLACESYIKASADSFSSVVQHFKYTFLMYKLIRSYIKKPSEVVDMDAKLEKIKNKMFQAGIISKVETKVAKKDLKKILREILTGLEEIENDNNKHIKVSNLELPLDYSNPYHAMRGIE